MFFVVITGLFLAFLVVVFIGVFAVKPEEISPSLVFNKPKIKIDMNVFDSEQFKNLKSFTQVQTVYSYSGVAADNSIKTGTISAVSEDQARTKIEDQGVSIIELKELQVGRENPFTPYYETVFTPATQ